MRKLLWKPVGFNRKGPYGLSMKGACEKLTYKASQSSQNRHGACVLKVEGETVRGLGEFTSPGLALEGCTGKQH